MDISFNDDKTFINVKLPKSYDYSTVNDFYDIFRDHQNKLDTIDLDFANTDYTDSSALGMLLHIRDMFPQASIRIYNCKPCIYRLFYIAKFKEMFVIERHEGMIGQVAA